MHSSTSILFRYVWNRNVFLFIIKCAGSCGVDKYLSCTNMCKSIIVWYACCSPTVLRHTLPLRKMQWMGLKECKHYLWTHRRLNLQNRCTFAKENQTRLKVCAPWIPHSCSQLFSIFNVWSIKMYILIRANIYLGYPDALNNVPCTGTMVVCTCECNDWDSCY